MSDLDLRTAVESFVEEAVRTRAEAPGARATREELRECLARSVGGRGQATAGAICDRVARWLVEAVERRNADPDIGEVAIRDHLLRTLQHELNQVTQRLDDRSRGDSGIGLIERRAAALFEVDGLDRVAADIDAALARAGVDESVMGDVVGSGAGAKAGAGAGAGASMDEG